MLAETLVTFGVYFETLVPKTSQRTPGNNFSFTCVSIDSFLSLMHKNFKLDIRLLLLFLDDKVNKEARAYFLVLIFCEIHTE